MCLFPHFTYVCKILPTRVNNIKVMTYILPISTSIGCLEKLSKNTIKV